MVKGLEGIRVIEVGGAAAMPLAGQLMASWGADVIHVEPPERGDMMRTLLREGSGGWVKPHEINFLWEHMDRNKKGIAIHIGSPVGQSILKRLIAGADVFLNNLRPYELEKFNLTYSVLAEANPGLIFANLTGYGREGPEKNTGGYDSVAFWARSGVMDLLHEPGDAPNISRPGYGDAVTTLCLLAGITTALLIRERTGVGQEVDVSLFNTAVHVLGFDILSCLTTGEDAFRPRRTAMGNPIRNLYPTKDSRWVMLGMTNAQYYWPAFCKAVEKPELEHDPRFATLEARARNAAELVAILDDVFRARTYADWIAILSSNKLVWSPVKTPLEVTRDEQAAANEFFVEWDHPRYGRIKVLNNPIKLSKTPAQIRRKAPDLGEHTDQILREVGCSEEEIAEWKKTGVIR